MFPLKQRRLKPQWWLIGSEKQEVGIETELRRETSKLAEDCSEGMQVKNG